MTFIGRLFPILTVAESKLVYSGVAGPLAAHGGGQIYRPFVLGFWNWRACLKHKFEVWTGRAAKDPT